jgi:hypothetical protein
MDLTETKANSCVSFFFPYGVPRRACEYVMQARSHLDRKRRAPTPVRVRRCRLCAGFPRPPVTLPEEGRPDPFAAHILAAALTHPNHHARSSSPARSPITPSASLGRSVCQVRAKIKKAELRFRFGFGFSGFVSSVRE